jgi:DNA-binding YbaB/EbfC family protein
LKDLGNLVKQAQKMKAEMDRIQEEVGSKTVEASSGGGMVTVVANGRQEIISVRIDPEVAKSEDLEMLQDLVVAAMNEALRKSRELFSQEVSKFAGGLGIPSNIFSGP